ncbi:hypothetical protein [Botrimarina sp.]|uniref:hypothetical protein n=1 Tax=Botrimarina sp. TaxID=2795802 RepID=UPI0032EAE8D4
MPEPNPSSQTLFAGLRQAIVARRGVLTSLAILAALWCAAQAAWRVFQPEVARRPQYRLTAAALEVNEPPPWVRGDLPEQVFSAIDEGAELSVLSPRPELERTLSDALLGHPWVRRVDSITLAPPDRVVARLEYRRPLATVMLPDGMTPIDVDTVRLPSSDLPERLVARLPRIAVAVGDGARAPFDPSPWPTQQLTGATAILAAFGDAWPELHLYEIHVELPPEVRGGVRFYSYRLRSTGNTIVNWGAAPGRGPTDEAPFEVKLARLRRFVEAEGDLDSVATSPELLDVRNGIEAHRRVVRRTGNRLAAKPGEEPETVAK